MYFLWPHNLWFLLLLPVLPALYLWLLHRRKKAALLWSSLRVVRAAQPGHAWRRHVPPALIFVALALMLFAHARPSATVPLPCAQSTVLLAIDISRSMRVDDVKPTRMVAAQEAAKAFLAQVPPHVEIGLVTFAGSAQVAQRATIDRPSVVAAIDAIQMQLGTAVGNAIVVSLAELFPDHGIDIGEMTFGERTPRAPAKEIQPVPPGSYESAVIILLTHGRRTTGVDALEAAKMAADRGVRIVVIGLGTPDGHTAMGDGMAMYPRLDKPTLKHVAPMTGGEYHHAATAEALRGVYEKLGSRLQVRKRGTELTGVLALVAAVAVVVGAGLSVMWFGRMV
jgi:Ca-activated chloride channel family protein